MAAVGLACGAMHTLLLTAHAPAIEHPQPQPAAPQHKPSPESETSTRALPIAKAPLSSRQPEMATISTQTDHQPDHQTTVAPAEQAQAVDHCTGDQMWAGELGTVRDRVQQLESERSTLQCARWGAQVAQALQQELAARDSYLQVAADVRDRLMEAQPEDASAQLTQTKHLLQQAVAEGRQESVAVLVDRREVQRKETSAAIESSVNAVRALMDAQTAQCARIEHDLPAIEALLSEGTDKYSSGDSAKASEERDADEVLMQSMSWCSEVASTSLEEHAVLTNRVLAAAMHAIDSEIEAFGREQQLFSQGGGLADGLIWCTNQVRQQVLATADPRKELHDTSELVSHYSTVLDQLRQSDCDDEEVRGLQNRAAAVASTLYELEMKKIDMGAQSARIQLSGSNVASIDKLTTDIEAVDSQVAALRSEQSHIQIRLAELAQGGRPELITDVSGSKGFADEGRGVRHTGLLVQRRFADYEQREQIASERSKVFVVELTSSAGSGLCVLKESVLVEEAAKEQWEREVCLLHRLKHPAVVSLNAVFLNRSIGYIEMPYYEGGDLSKWLSEVHPDSADLQSISRQIVQGIAHLHQHAVVHGDLQSKHILIAQNIRAVISHFRYAHDAQSSRSEPTTDPPGSGPYVAPEVQLGAGCTIQSDLWSLGAILHHTHCGSSPVLLPESKQVQPILADERLNAAIAQLLQRDPQERQSAAELLFEPYFTCSISSGEASAVDSKMEVLFAHIRMLKVAAAGRRVPLMITREQMVPSALEQFGLLDEALLLRPLDIRFENEEGVDDGGLTSDLYTQFFAKVFSPEYGLFECSDAGLFLPAAGCDRLHDLVTVGKMLAKSIYDMRPVPAPWAAAIFQYLLGRPMGVQHLEAYDRSLASGLRKLLALPGSEQLQLEFSEVADGDTRRVTDSNRVEFVQLRVHKCLVGDRREQLRAFGDGFMQIELGTHLSLFSCSELVVLACGKQNLDPEQLLACLTFNGFDASSRTPEYLREVISGLSPNQTRRLLYMVTAQCAIPASGLENPHPGVSNPDKLTVVNKGDDVEFLPVGRTCFYQLDLPDYNNLEMLSGKLLAALEHIDGTGFQLE